MRRALLLAVAIILAQTVWVEGIPPANAATPCGITAIDARTGVITARDTASQRTFQFKVTDPALLRSLKVGQTVFADFTARTVTLAANTRPCCSIIQTSTVPPITGSNPLPAPGAGTKTVSTNYSVPSPNAAIVALNPQLLLPDLVASAGTVISSCSWNESQGETCESECPPLVINISLGTNNISSRPLSGLVKIKLLAHPSGSVQREWSVTDVAAGGGKAPGWFTKTIVRCNQDGQTTVSSAPQPNYNLVVQTEASEADKNNNSRLIYIAPGSPIGP